MRNIDFKILPAETCRGAFVEGRATMAKKKEQTTVPVVSDEMIVDELGEEALEELSNNKGEE